VVTTNYDVENLLERKPFCHILGPSQLSGSTNTDQQKSSPPNYFMRKSVSKELASETMVRPRYESERVAHKDIQFLTFAAYHRWHPSCILIIWPLLHDLVDCTYFAHWLLQPWHPLLFDK